MSFANPIPLVDMNVIACILVATGLVTIWYGRALESSAGHSAGNSPRETSTASGWRFDPLADFVRLVTTAIERFRVSAGGAVQSVQASVAGAGQRRAKSAAVMAPRRKVGVQVVELADRLPIERQVEVLYARIAGQLDAAFVSERLHLTAGRQLDAADYALERLRAEIEPITTGRGARAETVSPPLVRIAMPRRARVPVAEAA